MQTNNFQPLRSQRGVTLVEVIVVMLISTMLIMVAALGIGVFFRKFKELSAWAELQKDGWECLNTIKNGISVGTANDMEFIGVANAVEIKLMNTIGNTSSGVEITTPSNSTNYPPDGRIFTFTRESSAAPTGTRGARMELRSTCFPARTTSTG